MDWEKWFVDGFFNTAGFIIGFIVDFIKILVGILGKVFRGGEL